MAIVPRNIAASIGVGMKPTRNSLSVDAAASQLLGAGNLLLRQS